MKILFHITVVLLFGRALVGAVDFPMPQAASQPLAVVRAESAESVRALRDTVTAIVFGLTLEQKGGTFPGMETGPESYPDFLDSLIENGAENLWYAVPESASPTTDIFAGGGWSLRDWPGGIEEIQTWLAKHGMDTNRVATRWDGESFSFATDSATLDGLTGGNVSDIAWSKRLADFLEENPDGVGLYVNPRPLIGILSMLTGEDIRSDMKRFHLLQPHSATVDVYSRDGDYLGFDLRADGLFPRPPYLTEASRYALSWGDQRRDDMVRLTIAAPLAYLELLGLDKNYLYPLNIDMLAFVPAVLTIDLWMDEYRHWNWSMVGLVQDKVRFKRQWRRVTGWLDLLAKTPLGIVDVDMAETLDGEAVRRVRIGDVEFCLGMGENDRVGDNAMVLMASGRVEDFPGIGGVRRDTVAVPRLLDWDVRLSEENRYALADRIAYHMRGYGITVPGLDQLESAVPPEETGSLWVEGTSVVLRSPYGMAAWLAPVIPEVEREIFYRLLP